MRRFGFGFGIPSKGRRAALIPALFALGEQGLWIDPSDLSTLFQDTAGTVPVTAPGQTVGLALDKSRGLSRGPELMVNGDFAAGATGYVEFLNGTISYEAQKMAATGISGNTGVYQDVSVVPGKAYEVSWVVASGTNWRVGFYDGASFTTSLYNNGLGSAVSGEYRAVVFPATNKIRVYTFTGAGNTATFDNISVRELKGSHLVQPTALARPTLGRHPVGGRRNLLTNTGFTGGIGGTPGTAPTGWLPTVIGEGVSTSFAAEKMAITLAGNARMIFEQSISVAVGDVLRLSVDVSKLSGTAYLSNIILRGGTATSTFVAYVNDVEVPVSTEVTSGRIAMVWTITGAGTFSIRLGLGTSNTAPAGSIELSRPSLVKGSVELPYQKVTSQWDVTEAGKADCWYLAFDGVDDFLITAATLDLSATDKLTVFAGAVPEAAATGVMVELTTDANSQPGGMNMAYLSGRWQYASRGSAAQAVSTSAAGSAPVGTPSVLTGRSVVSPSSVSLRQNQVTSTIATGNQGAGLYADALLYVGRRAGVELAWKGKLYQLPVRGADTPDAQVAAVEAQIAAKMGITL